MLALTDLKIGLGVLDKRTICFSKYHSVILEKWDKTGCKIENNNTLQLDKLNYIYVQVHLNKLECRGKVNLFQ